ncbi:neuralized-like protein 2 [Erpetoichthys calabaricus]|uniref:neuralized-like protein 2 n=1 Tax=Erpetoichthys calabaricus TaxID=27687 RepID=UPI00109FF8D1|nr:neuralized-like protein 2 [Erpetoichthys calabaricus]
MAAVCGQFMEFHQIHGANVKIDKMGTRATRIQSFADGICFSKCPLAPGEIFLVEIEDKELGWCGHLRMGLTSHDPRALEAVPEYSLPDLVSMGQSWIFAITRNHNRVLSEDDGEDLSPVASRNSKSFFTDAYLHVENIRIPRDKLVGRSRPGRFSHILDDLYKSNTLPPTARRSRIGVMYVPKGQETADMHIIINGEDMGASAKGIPTKEPLYAVVDVFAATKSVHIIQVEYGFPSLQTLCRQTIQKHIVHRMAIDWLDLPELLKHLCKYE